MITGSVLKLPKTTKLFFAVIFVFLMVGVGVIFEKIFRKVSKIRFNFIPKVAFITFTLLFCSSNLIKSQSILVSPSGDGGFETGTSFGANGWTAVNDGSNYWVVGTSTKYSGANSAYISNDGTNNTYSNNTKRTSHFYKDITVPAGEPNIELSFYLQGTGEADYDRLLIYTAPTSVTPVAGNPVQYTTNITGATLIYSQPAVISFYALQSITLPSSLSGTTFRLIVTWQNDDNTGVNPPASIDNVTVTSAVQTTFSNTGTFIVPNNVNYVKVECWGAGGGGGGSNSNNSGGSGGGGGSYSANTVFVTPGQVFNINIGTGGAGGTANAGTGGSGGISNVTSTGFITLTSNGGTGGAGNQGTIGNGGTATGGLVNTSGDNGTIGSTVGGNGGNGANGGAGGLGSTNAAGGAGSSPGGGGGGGEKSNSNNRAGGPGADGLVVFSLPTITTSITTLSGFTYPVGYGPSSEQSFTVGGTTLITNITVLPTDTFEISLSTGTSFTAESSISLLVNNGTVPTTTIYVRLKAGFSVGSITPVYKISCSSDYAVTKYVSCSGVVSILPVITPSPSSLSGFSYILGAGPSAQQSFLVNATGLTANVLVTAPSSYEVSQTSGSGFGPTTTVNRTGSTITNKTVYVRLKTGLPIGVSNENILLSSFNAVTQNVSCSGAVNNPTVSVSTFTLGGFIYTQGSGPSGEQMVTVGGTYLNANITVTAPTNFEVSKTSGGTFTASVSVTQTSGTAPATLIYVRMKSGLLVSSSPFGPANLTVVSNGAITQNVACSGIVASLATSISSNSTLNGFVYTFGNGPSVVQSFTVSGTSLGSDITVTPPTNYVICLTFSGTYVSTALTIPKAGTLVNAVPVYIKLKGGLAVASYNGETISLASSGATTKYVTCNGIVIAAPTISAGPTGLGSLCANANVTLTSTGSGITNQTWSGPNGFYSTALNPPLGLVTAANNGTYTVTGSALSGVNLLTNGDFEQGNTGFGSSYVYTTIASSSQGIYNVGPNPQTMNGGFCTCPDHTNVSPRNQMFIDGATSNGVIAWSQSVSVVPDADYQFSFWVQNLYNTSPAQLQLYVNGVPVGTVSNAPSNVGNPWVQFIYNTNSGNNTVLQLNLINKNLQPTGNDFALDDLVFQQIFAVSSSVNLTVNPTLAVSASITASASPLYSGGAVTFTAVPVNGGTSSVYQWKVNGTSVGTNSSVYTYTPVNGDNITCELTSNYPCTTGSPATSNTLTAILRTNFWKGTTSTDWGTASNWTANTIPSPGNDVEYATVANNTTAAINDLQLDVNRTIGNLVNNTTKALIIPAGKGLIVNNTITTDGHVDRIIIKASSSLPNGSLIFHNAQNLPVQATVEMYSKASWNLTAGTLLKYQWQYFGIPVSSVVAEPTFYGSFVRKWDETGTTIFNHWIQQNNASVLQPFYGYEIVQEAPKTITFQGALVNSNFSVSSLAVTGTALFPGQHIFANPYTAAIDIRLLTFGSNTQNIIYMYNTGAYGIWESIGGGTTVDGTIYPPGQYIAIPKNLAGTAQLPRQIPSMGTMLIRPVLPVSTNFDFGINYNSVVMNNSEMQRIPAEGEISTTGNVGTIIDVKTKYGSDRMWLFTESASTRGFDNGWDGQKIPGSALTPQLFAMEADGNYQVNTVPDIHDSELGFHAGLAIEDTLVFTHQNLEKRYAGLFLVDLIENKTIDITASGTSYTFMAESTPTPVKRFKIVTRPYEKEAADSESQVKIFSSLSTIFVQNLSTQAGECVVYDIAGRYLKKVPFGANCVTAISNNLKPGAYIARASAGSEDVSKRLIVR